jgi:ubiquinone/menaquinone biosynthesis C-methylase UbiE
MAVNTNRWNRLRYTLWAPVYDLAGRLFDARRRRSLALLAARPGERVLVVGAGTGADLPYLDAGATVLATDLTPAMLARARPRLRVGWGAAVMDGHDLAVATASVDAVVLHLVLAVMPDPVSGLREVGRVLRPGGRAVVFDKFVRGRPPALLRAANLVSNALFTDLTRDFHDLLARSGAALVIEHDEPGPVGGLFRHILVRRVDGAAVRVPTGCRIS